MKMVKKVNGNGKCWYQIIGKGEIFYSFFDKKSRKVKSNKVKKIQKFVKKN